MSGVVTGLVTGRREGDWEGWRENVPQLELKLLGTQIQEQFGDKKEKYMGDKDSNAPAIKKETCCQLREK